MRRTHHIQIHDLPEDRIVRCYADRISGCISYAELSDPDPRNLILVAKGRKDHLELAVETLALWRDGRAYIQGVIKAETKTDKAEIIANFGTVVESYL